jgi:hypothetical protein
LFRTKYPSGENEKKEKFSVGCVLDLNFHWPTKYHHSTDFSKDTSLRFPSYIFTVALLCAITKTSLRNHPCNQLENDFPEREKHYINYPIYSTDLKKCSTMGSPRNRYLLITRRQSIGSAIFHFSLILFK